MKSLQNIQVLAMLFILNSLLFGCGQATKDDLPQVNRVMETATSRFCYMWNNIYYDAAGVTKSYTIYMPSEAGVPGKSYRFDGNGVTLSITEHKRNTYVNGYSKVDTTYDYQTGTQKVIEFVYEQQGNQHRNTNYENGVKQGETIRETDPDKLLTKYFYYDGSGKLWGSSYYLDDANGNLLQYAYCDEYGVTNSVYYYEYSNSNTLVKINRHDQYGVTIDIETLELNKLGDVLHEIKFSDSGIKLDEYFCEYNTDGDQTKYVRYDVNGQETKKWLDSYLETKDKFIQTENEYYGGVLQGTALYISYYREGSSAVAGIYELSKTNDLPVNYVHGEIIDEELVSHRAALPQAHLDAFPRLRRDPGAGR